MAIVQSFGALQSTPSTSPTWGQSGGSLSLYGSNQAYATIYQTQPNVRICVDFLARNIAQLTLKAYRRVSDTDREHLPGHQLIRWMSRPNPATSAYRLKESLIADLGIYFNAYWLKVRIVDNTGKDAIGLVRLPPEEMRVEGGLLPTEFVWTSNGVEKRFPMGEIVYFNGYNPSNTRMGLAPLETLRRVIAEEAAVSDNRQEFWRNSSRIEGVWERSKDAPNWTPEQQQDFRDQWQDFSGGGSKAGMTAVGPKGMTYKEISFSAKDSEYILGGKLRREVCAAAYHIPQPMVGILDHATFSNIKEQHKHLYADTLGPWLEMIVQELERQLLIECDDQRDVYTEFNIAGKLAGSFEEQASALQMSVGRPWQTVNEARAKQNLPRDSDPESDRIAPQQGGPASNGQLADDATAKAVALEPVIHATKGRQHARLEKLPVEDRPAAFSADLNRWNQELSADLAAVTGSTDEMVIAAAVNAETLRRLEAEAHV